MNHGKTIKSLMAVLCSCGMLLMSQVAPALTSDAEQPIEIEADEFLLDDAQGLTIYTGSVVLIQGSIRLTGNKLTVKYDENDEIQEMLVDGTLAKFKQQEDSGEWTHGESIRLEYYPPKEELHLLKKAKVTQSGRLFSGDRIVYDIGKSIVKAHSSKTRTNGKQSNEKPAKRERVKIILPPKKKKP